MRLGSFKLGQAKLAKSARRVSDHTVLTAYDTTYIEAESFTTGQLVTATDMNGGDPLHWINGAVGGQQADGRKMRHAGGKTIAAASCAKITTTPLALFGDKVLELPEGDWAFQRISDDVLPDYRTLVVSCYAYKPSADNGTLNVQWSYNYETLTVTSATVSTITDSSQSWDSNEWADYSALIFKGSGRSTADYVGTRSISSNDGDTLTLGSAFGMVLPAGYQVDIVSWSGVTLKRLDNATGIATTSATVLSYMDWMRYFGTFRPTTTFDDIYVRFRSTSGTLYLDGAKLEEAYYIEAGISTSCDADTLNDTNRGWVVDAHIGRNLTILDGDDAGDRQAITDNTQTAIDCSAGFTTTPSAASTYIITPADADLRPTPFVDLSMIYAQFQELSAFNLTTGTLTIGGSLAEHPTLTFLNADGSLMMRAGDNISADVPRGLGLFGGACMFFNGGYALMKPDGSAVDSGERLKMSSEGIEAYNSDGELKAYFYSTGEVGIVLGESILQERVELSTQGIQAIDHEGRTFFNVNPVNKSLWLGTEESGNWLTYDDEYGLVPRLLNIPSGGEFRFGDGGDPGVDFTGLRMYRNDTTYRLEGQNSGTVQAYFDSDGKLYAGAGDVVLDSSGITATAGSIAGLTLASNTLTIGTGSNQVGIGSSDATIRIWAGGATPSTAPFRVGKGGAMVATSGFIGGWTIASTYLQSSAGGIKLDQANDRIYIGNDYLSWNGISTTIKASGELEAATNIVCGFNVYCVSGTLHAGAIKIYQTATAGAITPSHYFTIDLNGTSYKVACDAV